MRVYEGQFSAARPIVRSIQEKQRRLQKLKADRAAMKSHFHSNLLDTMDSTIASLEAEIDAYHNAKQPPQEKPAQSESPKKRGRGRPRGSGRKKATG